MKVKKLSWNLQFQNKGVIFTLDMFLALLVVITIFVASSYYFSRSDNALYNLQLTKIGNDVITLLDYNGVLNVPNQEIIQDKFNELLPSNYEMLISFESNNGNDFSIGVMPTNTDFIGSGKRFFIKNDLSDYYLIKFWIGLK